MKMEMLDATGFPTTVSSILLDAIRHAMVVSGRTERFLPLFNFVYRDGAPIVTVGGMIASEHHAALVEDLQLEDFDFVAYAEGDPFRIDVPHLTPKEKTALDRCLPQDGPLDRAFVEREYGFGLPQSMLDSYSRFYRHYPVFSELAF